MCISRKRYFLSFNTLCCKKAKKIRAFTPVILLGALAGAFLGAPEGNAAFSVSNDHSVISDNTIELISGLVYEEIKFTTGDGRTVSAFILDTDYGTAGSSIRFGIGVPDNDISAYGRQKVSEQIRCAAASGKNVLAGINADFFNLSTGEPEGLLVKDGLTIHDWYPTVEISSNRMNYRTFFGILDDGTAVIGDKADYDSLRDRIQHAVGGDYLLVKDGVIRSFDGEDTDNMNDLPVSPYSRTCVGIRSDGSVILIVIDGGTTNGLSLVEVAQLLAENGVEVAMNFDGGGSSAMVTKNLSAKEYEVKNTPSDGSERAVGDCLYIYSEMALEKDSDGFYCIDSIDDLAQINDNPYANYRLVNDLHLTAADTVPSVDDFYGRFDGQSYTINGYTSRYPLFKTLRPGSSVENLYITNASVEEDDFSNVAILAGTCDGASIRNVNVHGVVTKTSSGAAGGIVAELKSSLGAQSQFLVIDCYANVNVIAPCGNGVGGIFGDNPVSNSHGIVSACTAEGSVSGYRYVGGIGGRILESNNVWIDQNVVNGTTIEGEVHVGGVVGMGKCYIQKCMVMDAGIIQTSATTEPKFAASFITSWHNYQHAKIRFNIISSGSIQTSYEPGSYNISDGAYSNMRMKNYVSNSLRINGQFKTGADAGYHGVLVSEDQLATEAFYRDYAKYSFDALGGSWEWNAERKLPVLKNTATRAMGISLDRAEATVCEGECLTLNAAVNPRNSAGITVRWSSSNPEVATVENGVVTAVGIGTSIITATSEDGIFTADCTITVNLAQDADGYYLLRSVGALERINDDIYAKYRLANNLSVSGEEVPCVDAFYGEFDGQGYTINGYSSSYPLFKLLYPGAVVENLSVTNAIVEESDFEFVAIIAGKCNGATIRNVNVEGTVVQNSTSGICGAAGIVAYVESTSGAFLVENCSAQVVIHAASRGYCGAIFGETGQAANGTIRACLAANSIITGKNFVGAIGGRMFECSNMWVEDCMVYGVEINAEIHAGGIIGMAKGGIRNCIVADVNIRQESSTSQPQYSASFISSWQNYNMLAYENNVVLSGSIQSTYAAGSYNVADGEIGVRINNYVSSNLSINGEFKTGTDSKYHGIVATSEELSNQSFYEAIGFDFTENGSWEWRDNMPMVKSA